jgi:hypothetical protein
VKGLEDRTDLTEQKALEEEVKSTKALIQTLLQTLKSFRLYEANHPLLSKFRDRLKHDFESYFDEFDSFSLQVGEHQLFYSGKVIYESEDVKESLAFAFYKDGIRELRFHKGLEFKEMIDFLEVVRKADWVNRMVDDLVTLLWEKDFSHISFSTVDEFLEKGSVLVPATEEDLHRGQELKFEERTGQADEAEEPSLPALTEEEVEKALDPTRSETLTHACQLMPDELEKISHDVSLELETEYLHALNNNLLEVLLHLGEDTDAYENMISYFQQIIESLLTEGKAGKVVTILKGLTNTIESIVLKDKQIFAIRRILESCSGSQAIKLLGKTMQGDGDAEGDSIQEYMQFLTKEAIPHLCLLLGELPAGKWRKLVSDPVIKLSQEDIEPLTKYLSDRNAGLVCQILSILGEIGHPSTVKYLGSLVTHKDPRVREETLQLLVKFGENGKGLIMRLLKDSSAEIRSKASINLAKVAKGQAVKPLMEIILSEDFYKRNYEEKVSFFKALGETGSREAIPFLQKIAKKRFWFKKAKWEEMRVCAMNTLRIIQGDRRQTASQHEEGFVPKAAAAQQSD